MSISRTIILGATLGVLPCFPAHTPRAADPSPAVRCHA
jgi:hypothetical protein